MLPHLFLISQLYNDQTLATTIKHTAILPNLKSRNDYDKHNIKVYIFTDNHSVVALNKNCNLVLQPVALNLLEVKATTTGPADPGLCEYQ